MKPQSRTILRHLLEGGEVTRDSAYLDFDIQNLTARLSELTRLGFDIIRSTVEARTKSGRKMRVITWKLGRV